MTRGKSFSSHSKILFENDVIKEEQNDDIKEIIQRRGSKSFIQNAILEKEMFQKQSYKTSNIFMDNIKEEESESNNLVLGNKKESSRIKLVTDSVEESYSPSPRRKYYTNPSFIFKLKDTILEDFSENSIQNDFPNVKSKSKTNSRLFKDHLEDSQLSDENSNKNTVKLGEFEEIKEEENIEIDDQEKVRNIANSNDLIIDEVNSNKREISHRFSKKNLNFEKINEVDEEN